MGGTEPASQRSLSVAPFVRSWFGEDAPGQGGSLAMEDIVNRRFHAAFFKKVPRTPVAGPNSCVVPDKVGLAEPSRCVCLEGLEDGFRSDIRRRNNVNVLCPDVHSEKVPCASVASFEDCPFDDGAGRCRDTDGGAKHFATFERGAEVVANHDSAAHDVAFAFPRTSRIAVQPRPVRRESQQVTGEVQGGRLCTRAGTDERPDWQGGLACSNHRAGQTCNG